MKYIEIKKWTDGSVIYSGEFESIKECLEDGVSKGVSFNYAELNDAELNYAKLNCAKLNCAELNYAKLNYAKLDRAELNYAKLNYAKLDRAELNYAKLNRAKLPKMSFCICAGQDYYLFISPMVVQAGCQSYSPDDWRKMSKGEIANMDGKKALKFYPKLLDLMDFFLGEGDRPGWVKEL